MKHRTLSKNFIFCAGQLTSWVNMHSDEGATRSYTPSVIAIYSRFIVAYQYVQLHKMKLSDRKPYQHRSQYLTWRVSVNVFSTWAKLSALEAGTLTLPRLSDGPSSLWQAKSRIWRCWTNQLCHYWQPSSAFKGKSTVHFSVSSTGRPEFDYCQIADVINSFVGYLNVDEGNLSNAAWQWLTMRMEKPVSTYGQ